MKNQEKPAYARMRARERERGQDQRAAPATRISSTFTMRQAIVADEAFEKLAQQLIEAADKVQCSVDDYIAGLRYILGEVEVALQAAKEMQGDEQGTS